MRSLVTIAACLALAPVAAHAQEADPQAGSEIYKTDLTTRWGREVTPENAWRSYPRPQLERERWQNLNGLWDYAIAPKAAPLPERMDGQILVPFAVESKLSGVTRKVTPDDRVWYRRSFDAPDVIRPPEKQMSRSSVISRGGFGGRMQSRSMRSSRSWGG